MAVIASDHQEPLRQRRAEEMPLTQHLRPWGPWRKRDADRVKPKTGRLAEPEGALGSVTRQ